jgi:hypothetical protein
MTKIHHISDEYLKTSLKIAEQKECFDIDEESIEIDYEDGGLWIRGFMWHDSPTKLSDITVKVASRMISLSKEQKELVLKTLNNNNK